MATWFISGFYPTIIFTVYQQELTTDLKSQGTRHHITLSHQCFFGWGARTKAVQNLAMVIIMQNVHYESARSTVLNYSCLDCFEFGLLQSSNSGEERETRKNAFQDQYVLNILKTSGTSQVFFIYFVKPDTESFQPNTVNSST